MEPGVTIIPVVFWSKSGLAAARPAATGLRNGSLWVSTDTKDIDQVQGGSWVTIFDFSALTAALNIHEAISDAHHAAVHYAWLTVTQFQEVPAAGDMSNPTNLNDNDTGTTANTTVQDRYLEVLFESAVWIKQFRLYGDSANTGDGTWKLQYRNAAGAWVDWKTGIATHGTSAWISWVDVGDDVVASGIKIIATALDGSGNSRIKELEVKF